MNHYEIETKYKNHILLRRKGAGDAAELVGKTVVLLFFVNDKTSAWTPSERARFLQLHNAAMKTVVDKAEKFSVSVTIDTVVEEVTVPYVCDRENPDKWCNNIMEIYGRRLFKGYRKHYRETLGYEQIAVTFALNRSFRAFATNSTSRFYPEYSVLKNSASQHTIIHELFHQFGARDIYPLENCMDTVKKLNYRSIMGYAGNLHIDSLTAYAIGWCKEIDEDAVELLEKTKHLKIGDFIKFQKRS